MVNWQLSKPNICWVVLRDHRAKKLWGASEHTALNFAKRCIVLRLSQVNNKNWESPSSLLSYKSLELKLRVFLAGHTIAMVTYCAAKLTETYSAMIGQIFDTMSLASTNMQWL